MAHPMLNMGSAMINALFNNAQYQSMKMLMDAAVVRHTVLAGNVANVNTPGYQRQDIGQGFQLALEQAVKNQDVAQLKQLTPTIQADPKAPPVRLDGSNVNMEREMVEIAKNSAEFEVMTNLVTKQYNMLRTAITGKV